MSRGKAEEPPAAHPEPGRALQGWMEALQGLLDLVIPQSIPGCPILELPDGALPFPEPQAQQASRSQWVCTPLHLLLPEGLEGKARVSSTGRGTSQCTAHVGHSAAPSWTRPACRLGHRSSTCTVPNPLEKAMSSAAHAAQAGKGRTPARAWDRGLHRKPYHAFVPQGSEPPAPRSHARRLWFQHQQGLPFMLPWRMPRLWLCKRRTACGKSQKCQGN